MPTKPDQWFKKIFVALVVVQVALWLIATLVTELMSRISGWQLCGLMALASVAAFLIRERRRPAKHIKNSAGGERKPMMPRGNV